MNLDNPKDKESIQETMRQGQSTDFWRVILQSLDRSIEYLEGLRDGEEIADLPADEYKAQAEILKGKIANLRKLKELPSTLIQYLQEPDQSEGNFDPYAKAEDFNN